MTLRSIVWRELRERPWSLGTSVLAILLGVAALVAIRHMTVFSERQVARQLESLGANILVLPKSTSLQDYYAADMSEHRLPEEAVAQIMLAGLPGVERLSPKLCLPVTYEGRQAVVTGILPQAALEANLAWQSVNLLQARKHVGCTKAHSSSAADDTSAEALVSRRTIAQLGERDVVLGADAATKMEIKLQDKVQLFDASFRVVAILPATGTVDDGRMFVHLHALQELAKTGEVVSAIEVMGCCEDAAGRLVPQLSELLPDAKVVTISQVVQTQVGVNRLMTGSSWFVLAVMVLVGAVSVMSSISSNVRERRREIGTLLALGASPNLVLRLFLLKAGWIGVAGGLSGCAIGLLCAMLAAPHWLGVAVSPLWNLAGYAIAAAIALSLVAAYWPARQAARLDPCLCFREV